MMRHDFRGHTAIRSLLRTKGFTLLEVMIAVAIIAIGFVTLLGTQSRSLTRATEAKFNNIAPILAATRLAEVEGGSLPMIAGEGDFGADFPEYVWRLTVDDVDVNGRKIPASIANELQKATFAVTSGESRFQYTVTKYVRRKNE